MSAKGRSEELPMTRFPIRRPLLWAAVLTLGAAASALLPTRVAAVCVGDCDGDGVVTTPRSHDAARAEVVQATNG